MKLKKLKKIKINCFTFNITWTKEHGGGSFDYRDRSIIIGVKDSSDDEIFMVLCHEIMEIIACEMSIRLSRPDVESDYIFVYDHRQYETMINIFSGIISEFIL